MRGKMTVMLEPKKVSLELMTNEIEFIIEELQRVPFNIYEFQGYACLVEKFKKALKPSTTKIPTKVEKIIPYGYIEVPDIKNHSQGSLNKADDNSRKDKSGGVERKGLSDDGFQTRKSPHEAHPHPGTHSPQETTGDTHGTSSVLSKSQKDSVFSKGITGATADTKNHSRDSSPSHSGVGDASGERHHSPDTQNKSQDVSIRERTGLHPDTSEYVFKFVDPDFVNYIREVNPKTMFFGEGLMEGK